MDLSTFFAFVGGVAAAMLGAWMAQRYDFLLKQFEVRQQIDGVLASVELELRLCTDVYFATLGKKIAEAENGKLFKCTFNPRLEYTLAYKNNLHLIGQIESEALRTEIVGTHLQWAFLFEYLYEVASISQRHEDWILRADEVKDPKLQAEYFEVVDKLHAYLCSQPEKLKPQQQACLQATRSLSVAVAQYRQGHQPTKPRLSDIFDLPGAYD